MPLPLFQHHIQRPSPHVHRVGFSTSLTRLPIGSLALRPALLLFGNLRPRVTTAPLPHATGAYGQLPGRDFNPLDLLLLLRTDATLCLNHGFPGVNYFQALNVLEICGVAGGYDQLVGHGRGGDLSIFGGDWVPVACALRHDEGIVPGRHGIKCKAIVTDRRIGSIP